MVDTEFTSDMVDMLVRHLCAVRARLATLRNALFVLCVESNMGSTASDVKFELNKRRRAGMVLGMPRFVVMEETKRLRGGGAGGDEPTITAGLSLTNELKVRGVEAVNTLLRAGAIFFARQFLTGLAALNPPTEPVTPDDTRAAIIDQLVHYMRHLSYKNKRGNNANNVWRPPVAVIKFSGKGSSGAARDDWVSAFIELPLVMELFRTSAHYASFRRS